MSYYGSNLGYVGIASQASQKTTAKTTSKMFVPYLSETCVPEIDEEVLHEGGDGKYDVSSVKTQHREKIGFSCYVRPKMAGQLYGHLLGKDTPSHLTTTPFYHTVTVKTTDLATTVMQPWMTLERKLTGTQVQRIRSVKLSSISLDAEAGKPVVMAVEGTGLSAAVVTTAQSDTYEVTTAPMSFYHGTFHVNAPTTTNFDIKSFSIKLTTENDEGIQTTGLTRKDILNLRVTSEITLALNYTDFIMWKKANYGAGSAPTESYSDGSLDVILKTSAGVNERRLQITIPKVRLKPHAINLDPAVKILEQPLSGMAMKQSSTELVTVMVYNTIATSQPL